MPFLFRLSNEQIQFGSQSVILPVTGTTIISTTGLISYYSFNSGSVVTTTLANYASGNAVFDAKFTGTNITTNSFTSRLLTCGYFNTQNNGTINNITLNNQLGISIACWINTVSNGQYNGYGIECNGVAGGTYHTNIFAILDNGQVWEDGSGYNNYTTGFALNTWYHVVLTRSYSATGTNCSVIAYCNGEQTFSSNTGTCSTLSSMQYFHQMGASPYANRNLRTPNMYLDECRVYNRVLTSAEAASLYSYR